MPEISVVLPVRNAAKTIARAVDSILKQSFADIELIVVDDGSEDATAEELRGVDDSRLVYVHQEHCGVASAANCGTKLAKAPLIARMDADDYSHPRRLERQFDFLHEHNFDVVGCQIQILNDQGAAVGTLQRYERWINERTRLPDQILAFRFVEFPLVNPTLLGKRSYFELGFRNNDYPEDYDLMLRAAASGFRFGKVPELHFDWTDHPHRLTRQDSRFSQEAFMACRREHFLAGPLRSVSSVDLWGVGQTGKEWLRWLHSEDVAVRRAYDVSQRRIGKVIHGVRVDDPAQALVADGTPLVVAVGAEFTKDIILPQLHSLGYVPGRDAWFVA